MQLIAKEPASLTQFDVPGALVGVGSLATLMFTLARVESQGWASVATVAGLGLAGALIIGTHLAAHGSVHLAARSIAAAGLAVVAGGGVILSRADEMSSYVGGLFPGLCLIGLGAGLVFAAVAERGPPAPALRTPAPGATSGRTPKLLARFATRP